MESVEKVPWTWDPEYDSIEVKEKDGFVLFRMSTDHEPPHGTSSSKWFVGPKLTEGVGVLVLSWGVDTARYLYSLSAIVSDEHAVPTTELMCELRVSVRARMIHDFTRRAALKRCR